MAKDKNTGQVFSGPVVKLNPSPRVPPPIQAPPLNSRQLEGLASGGYFNHSLADYVELPQESAIYDVHVEFRGFESNIVTIELVREPD
jgi:hypothetical protein